MDVNAHVNNTRFFTYFESARLAWFESVRSREQRDGQEPRPEEHRDQGGAEDEPLRRGDIDRVRTGEHPEDEAARDQADIDERDVL